MGRPFQVGPYFISDMSEEKTRVQIVLPDGMPVKGCKVLLHACCAPCSAAIVECLLGNGIQPTVFFSNPNIFPLEEYDVRKHELFRFLQVQGVPYVEDDYDHPTWLSQVKGFEKEPERGHRCTVCFRLRLLRAAQYASANAFPWFATTLASSRWKDIDQINAAGLFAQNHVTGTHFWPQNWRKGGLQQRRGELLKINGFYNQQYCGCEYSLAFLRERERQRLIKTD